MRGYTSSQNRDLALWQDAIDNLTNKIFFCFDDDWSWLSGDDAMRVAFAARRAMEIELLAMVGNSEPLPPID